MISLFQLISLLGICLFSLVSSSTNCRSQPFLSATRFNAVVLGDFTATSDTEGAVAAKGNIKVTSYTIAEKLVASGCPSNDDTCIAGGSIEWNTGGDVKTGNLVYGSGSEPRIVTMGCGGKKIQRDSSSLFATLESDLIGTSTYLASLTATGTITRPEWAYRLSVNSALDVNVFETTCSILDQNKVGWELKGGSPDDTVIVNIRGTGPCTMNNMGYLWTNGQTPWTRVIWNFPDATAISFSVINGTLLAPRAAVTTDWGNIDGQMFAKSWSGGTQINWYRFAGCVPESGTTSSSSSSSSSSTKSTSSSTSSSSTSSSTKSTTSSSTSGSSTSSSTSGSTTSGSTSSSSGTSGSVPCPLINSNNLGACTCKQDGNGCSCSCPCC